MVVPASAHGGWWAEVELKRITMDMEATSIWEKALPLARVGHFQFIYGAVGEGHKH